METVTERESEKASALNALLPYAAWLTALLSFAGSLFFSEVMDLPPCSLCWYQRIAMYPLVLTIGASILMRDSRLKLYSLPLAVCGLAVAAYHNLLYYGVIPTDLSPCTEGVPCNAVQLELLGFITIPLMGLAAFIFIVVCLLAYRPERKAQDA